MAKKKKEHRTFDKMFDNKKGMNFNQGNKKGKAPTFNKVHRTTNK